MRWNLWVLKVESFMRNISAKSNISGSAFHTGSHFLTRKKSLFPRPFLLQSALSLLHLLLLTEGSRWGRLNCFAGFPIKDISPICKTTGLHI